MDKTRTMAVPAPLTVTYCGYDWCHPRGFIIDRPGGWPEWIIIQVTVPDWWWRDPSDGTIPVGWCAIIPPGQPHRYGGGTRPFSNHWLHVQGDLDPDLPVDRPFPVADAPAISQAFRTLHQEFTTRATHWEDACAAHARLLMIALGRGHEQASPGRRSDDGPLLALRARLRAEPGRAWSATGMAAAVGLSPSRLRIRYRNAFGVGPLEDLLAARLDHARALIADGVTVATAAQRAGFHDLSYFHRLYRRRLGTTPAAVRRG